VQLPQKLVQPPQTTPTQGQVRPRLGPPPPFERVREEGVEFAKAAAQIDARERPGETKQIMPQTLVE